uniref:Uncharacterized protein n=1 Tax=Anguilla anguilla TaxID=7936 RepID=A0A0E9TLY3_ANGAN
MGVRQEVSVTMTIWFPSTPHTYVTVSICLPVTQSGTGTCILFQYSISGMGHKSLYPHITMV